ncbi:hypothetical protein AVEN_185630-1 [Araneus ventricosus]|uniref:Uncharacterized protein n=1 Tax=Araneus ventricosus TaxID=182803 RepID=A0A4Y2AJP0_ARAVE|nr:hypothetical protein AVEN_118521-1 [Araneus ventricosus]GBL79962.1 hypothetical protein AVEN_185630-1 [Araneus ventricosus]
MAYTDVGIPMSPGTLTHQDLRFQLLQAEPCSAISALDAISPLNFSIHLRKRIFKEINIYSNLKICVYLKIPKNLNLSQLSWTYLQKERTLRPLRTLLFCPCFFCPWRSNGTPQDNHRVSRWNMTTSWVSCDFLSNLCLNLLRMSRRSETVFFDALTVYN